MSRSYWERNRFSNPSPRRQGKGEFKVTFSDDDLKRLKEYIKRRPEGYIAVPDFEALLARLEAAERVIDRLNECNREQYDEESVCSGWYCNSWIDSEIRVWRKVAGK
jgi:hypothetical protein